MKLLETFKKVRERAGMWALTGEWQDMAGSRLRRTRPKVQASQDATLDFGRREDMTSAARTLCQINGIGKSFLSSYSNYTIGTCVPKWFTSDKEWNRDTQEQAKNWMAQCHARGQHNFRTLAELVVKSMIRDGDILLEKMDADGFPMVDLVESDRITSNISGFNADSENTIGGINFDSKGRATGYNVCERTTWGGFQNKRVIPASSALHIFDTDRVDAKRGVTHFAAAIHHLFDWDETFAAEKAAQKTASKLALIISNTLGRAPSSAFATTDTNTNGDVVPVQNIGDGAIQYQANGDKVEAFMSQRPGDGWFRMCEMIVRLISLSLGLPYEFVWNMAGLAGPGVRLTTKLADKNFQRTMETIEGKFLYPTFAWWINFEMDHGRIPFNAEWTKYGFVRPIMSSIDAQRETNGDIMEMNAGTKSGHSICEENNRDVEEEQEELYHEANHRIALCQRPDNLGVTPDDIRINPATVARIQAEAVEAAQGGGGEPGKKGDA